MKNLNYFIYTLIHIITISSTVYAMQLEDHLLNNCKKRPMFKFECNKCHDIRERTTNIRYYRKDHSECKYNNGKYKLIQKLMCPMCEKEYQGRVNLKNHILREHKSIQACPFCGDPCNNTTPVNNFVHNNNTQKNIPIDPTLDEQFERDFLTTIVPITYNIDFPTITPENMYTYNTQQLQQATDINIYEQNYAQQNIQHKMVQKKKYGHRA